jgi:hypothetical protein
MLGFWGTKVENINVEILKLTFFHIFDVSDPAKLINQL